MCQRENKYVLVLLREYTQRDQSSSPASFKGRYASLHHQQFEEWKTPLANQHDNAMVIEPERGRSPHCRYQIKIRSSRFHGSLTIVFIVVPKTTQPSYQPKNGSWNRMCVKDWHRRSWMIWSAYAMWKNCANTKSKCKIKWNVLSHSCTYIQYIHSSLYNAHCTLCILGKWNQTKGTHIYNSIHTHFCSIISPNSHYAFCYT